MEQRVENLDYASIDATNLKSLHRIGLAQLLFNGFEILFRPKLSTGTVKVSDLLATDQPIREFGVERSQSSWHGFFVGLARTMKTQMVSFQGEETPHIVHKGANDQRRKGLD